jgi:UDP-N-acetylmuramoylalanine--D-glutamate ligase
MRKEIDEKLKEHLEAIGVELELGGHTKRAISKCSMIVLSPGVPSTLPVILEAKKAGIPIISEVELAYRQLKGQPLVGVTGTNGKTTTVSLIAEILRNSGRDVRVAGNIGFPLSYAVRKIGVCEVLVAEVSSFQLENIVKFKPWISVLLNITEDHLDRYKNMQEYLTAKEKIFMNQGEEDYAILNADSDEVCRCERKIRAKKIYLSKRQEVKRGVFIKEGRILSTICGGVNEVCLMEEVNSYNLTNILASIAVGILFNVPLSTISKTIKNFKGLPHRIEYVGVVDGVKFINDSKATNVAATCHALENIESPIILIAGGKDKGSDYSKLGDLIKRKVKHLILLGEAKYKIIDSLQDFHNFSFAEDMRDAVREAFHHSKPGDCVLLSPTCSSYDMFRNFEERGEAFKAVVKELMDEAEN